MTPTHILEKILEVLNELDEEFEKEEKKKKSTIKLILEALESIESSDQLKVVKNILKELLEGRRITIEFGIGEGISSDYAYLRVDGEAVLTSDGDEYKESLIGAVYGFLENLANAGLIKHKREENYPYEEHIFWI